jgi:hypothetical protein
VKVTVIIPDELVRDVQILSNTRNITDAVIIALKNYIALQKLKEMGEAIDERPLQFSCSAEEIRDLNRQHWTL